jgi:polyhydroxybutyrate depolymerase
MQNRKRSAMKRTIIITCRPGFLLAIAACVFMLSMNSPAGAAARIQPGTQTISLEFGGRSRSYIVHVPPQAAGGEPLPVVLNFHGGGSNAAQDERYTGMDTVADRDGFIAVYPNGTGFFRRMLTWNAGGCCAYAERNSIDDVGFTRAVIDDLSRRARIDSRRIYATGISNGGMMAYRLGAELSDRIAAIAPVEAVLVVSTSGPSRPVPLMAFNSVDDRYVPYGGGFGRNGNRAHSLPFPAVDAVIARWCGFDKCPATPSVGATLKGAAGSADAGNTATRYAWGPCAQRTEVVLWKLSGSGHVWPGATANPRWLLGPGTGVIDANQQMWEFFRRFELPR